MTVKTLVGSLRSKRFQSRFLTKSQSESKNKLGGGGGKGRGEEEMRCPQTPDSGKRPLIVHGSVCTSCKTSYIVPEHTHVMITGHYYVK